MRLISTAPVDVWLNIQNKARWQNVHILWLYGLLITLWNGRGLGTTASLFCASMFPERKCCVWPILLLLQNSRLLCLMCFEWIQAGRPIKTSHILLQHLPYFSSFQGQHLKYHVITDDDPDEGRLLQRKMKYDTSGGRGHSAENSWNDQRIKNIKKKKHGDEASLNIVSLWSMDDFSSSTVSFSSGRISFSKCLHLDSLLCCPCALVARIAGLQHNVSSSASFLPLQTWSQPTSAALPRIIGLIFVLSAAALHSNNRLLPCVYTGTESKVGDGLLFPPLR